MNTATNTINGFMDKFRKDHGRRNRMIAILLVLSLIVTSTVVYGLRLTALTLAGDADCGRTEHTHSEECVAAQTICGLSEDSAHTHTEACYEQTYTCGFEPEYNHVHTLECYSDDNADVETAAFWEQTFGDVKLIGSWGADTAAIARSQIGYKESGKNWRVDENLIKNGYTRFGAWFGETAIYTGWDATFASFCLNYAHAYDVEGGDIIPYAAGAASWAAKLKKLGMYNEAGTYIPKAGDIIFLDDDADGSTDRTGIVDAVGTLGASASYTGLVADGTLTQEKGGETASDNVFACDTESLEELCVYTIEGDRYDEVGMAVYSLSNAKIAGYIPVDEIGQAVNEAGDMAVTAADGTTVTYDSIGFAKWDYEGNNNLDGNYTEGVETSGTPGFVYAWIAQGSGINCGEYYIIDSGIYSTLSYAGQATDDAAGQANLLENAQVAYCYNRTEIYPFRANGQYSATTSSGAVQALYEEMPAATSRQFKDTATTPRVVSSDSVYVTEYGTGDTDQTLQHKVMSIVLNGYPHNAAGLQGSLTGAQLRVLTQYAIWYYTDSMGVRFFNQGNGTYIMAFYENDSTATSNPNGYLNAEYVSSGVKDVFESLLQSNVTLSDTQSGQINLYDAQSQVQVEASDGTIYEKSFQNLLTVGLNDDSEETVELPQVSISAIKELDGGSMQGGEFTFYLQDADGNYLTDANGNYISATNSANGSIVFDAISLPRAEATYTYKIVEDTTNTSSGYTYDPTPVKTVQVHVYKSVEEITEFVQTNPTGYEYNAYDSNGVAQRSVSVNGTSYPAYCINASGGRANGTYLHIVTPTDEKLGAEIKAATYTPYSGTLSEELRRLVYYFEDKKIDDTFTYTLNGQDTTIPWNQANVSTIFWYVTGHSTTFDQTMVNIGLKSEADLLAIIKKIVTEETADIPDSYKLVLLTGTSGVTGYYGQQPMVMGYDTSSQTSTVTGTEYVALQQEEPTFENSMDRQSANGSITLTKTVGTGGDTAKLFRFTIRLWETYSNSGIYTQGSDGVNYYWTGTDGLAGQTFPVTMTGVDASADNYITEITFSDQRVISVVEEKPYPYYTYATVELADGQGVTISNLPDGTYYEIIEANYTQDGYGTPVWSGQTNKGDSAGISSAITATAQNPYEGTTPEVVEYSTTLTGIKYLDDMPSTTAFTFQLLDSDDTVLATQTSSTADGSFHFDITGLIAGNTYEYTVREVKDGRSYTWANDRHVTITVGEDGQISYSNVDSAYGVVDEDLSRVTNSSTLTSDGGDADGYFINPHDNRDNIRVYCFNSAITFNTSTNYDALYADSWEDIEKYSNQWYTSPYENSTDTDPYQEVRKALWWWRAVEDGKTEDYDMTVHVMTYYLRYIVGDNPDNSMANDSLGVQKYKPIIDAYVAEHPIRDEFVVYVFATGDQDGNGKEDSQPLIAAFINDTSAQFSMDNKTADSIEIDANKTLTGGELSHGDFTFALYDLNGNVVAESVNYQNGTIKFYMEDPGYGTHTYIMKEIAGENTGIDYDESEYTVVISRPSGNTDLDGVSAAGTVTAAGTLATTAVVTISANSGTAYKAYPIYSDANGTQYAPGTYALADGSVTAEDLAGYVNSIDDVTFGNLKQAIQWLNAGLRTSLSFWNTSTGSYGSVSLTSASNKALIISAMCGYYSSVYSQETWEAIINEMEYWIGNAEDEGYITYSEGNLAIFTRDGYAPLIAFYPITQTSLSETVTYYNSQDELLATVTYNSDDTVTTTGTLPTFVNERLGAQMPQTGGPGIVPFVTAGAVILLTPVILLGREARRKTERRYK